MPEHTERQKFLLKKYNMDPETWLSRDELEEGINQYVIRSKGSKKTVRRNILQLRAIFKGYRFRPPSSGEHRDESMNQNETIEKLKIQLKKEQKENLKLHEKLFRSIKTQESVNKMNEKLLEGKENSLLQRN
ncbi:Oidioi.mRNA.OKI2018_I69.chr2.g4253.t1.cds [Oikopleura dioica]|uniref:Oidioi.mRNA.OKI2018_I69.chr2.g4253.t1.cds n=1 Tax=Oikopleura dioica TaxID=34765 RepID=A0ABN7SWI6_OIKDI|nr:Oidioi.mRNA.OKI2018_I69.chr2.g4253.t1.cds [Oikopleura dioica]